MSEAKPARSDYQRNLPHLQRRGIPLFVTFRVARGLELPESVRDAVLKHCLHDHGGKLQMLAAVVMPDHAHLLFTPLLDAHGAEYGLAEIMHGIKGASSHSVNRALGRRGAVWQDESFDHLLRSTRACAPRANTSVTILDGAVWCQRISPTAGYGVSGSKA